MKAIITGMGSHIPDKVLTNFDLEKMVETSDEWIRTRTGIQERRISSKEDLAWEYAAKAGKRALEDAHLSPEEIDGIICGGVYSEYIYPSMAALVQKELGCTNAWAFDMQAACTFTVYAMHMALPHIETGRARNILIIGSELFSRALDWTDRNTCVLFGDAAAALVLSATEEEGRGVLSSVAHAKGSMVVYQEHYHSATPFVKMDGPALYREAVTLLEAATREACEKAGVLPADLDLLVPHQANLRIMDAVAKRLEVPLEKIPVVLDRYGNTSGTSVILAMIDAREKGMLKQKDLVAITAIGGGLVWGTVLLRW